MGEVIHHDHLLRLDHSIRQFGVRVREMDRGLGLRLGRKKVAKRVLWLFLNNLELLGGMSLLLLALWFTSLTLFRLLFPFVSNVNVEAESRMTWRDSAERSDEERTKLTYRLDSLRSPGMYGSPAFPHSPQLSRAQKMGNGMMEERGLFDEDVPGLGMGIYS